MKKLLFCLCLLSYNFCYVQENAEATGKAIDSKFTIAFGSCNKTQIKNMLWEPIVAENPNLWIWGGDNIYADTSNMIKLEKLYQRQDEVKAYQYLKSSIPVIGTWDDHDYGINDGGVEFAAKKESQQLFLDFLDVSEDDPIRFQEGIYDVHDYKIGTKEVRVIVLDTRYFRSALTKAENGSKRFQPNTYGKGTLLGEKQWYWLEEQLKQSKADFNIVVSSIQLLSKEHGFETWGNFPHEVDRFKKVVRTSAAKGVIVISGDRHISEFSKTRIEGMSYPLIDFTSSGLTHAYTNFSGEANTYRIGEVIATESFGLIELNLKTRKVIFKMIGKEGEVLQELWQVY